MRVFVFYRLKGVFKHGLSVPGLIFVGSAIAFGHWLGHIFRGASWREREEVYHSIKHLWFSPRHDVPKRMQQAVISAYFFYVLTVQSVIFPEAVEGQIGCSNRSGAGENKWHSRNSIR